jgi:hypothetical protein
VVMASWSAASTSASPTEASSAAVCGLDGDRHH